VGDTMADCRTGRCRLRLTLSRLSLSLLAVMLPLACGAATCLLAGCGSGKEAGYKGSAPRKTIVAKTGIPLPEWAPENPSPEFLRAAKALKPLPADAGGGGSPLAVAFYEMFGALTNEQIAAFLECKQGTIPADSSDEVRALFREKYGAEEVGGQLVYSMNEVSVPVKSLSPAQRKAFDEVQAAWSEEMKAQGEEDLLVRLYKIGASEDLSNVDVSFTATGHEVHFCLLVRDEVSPNETRVRSLGTSFAQL